MYPAKYKASNSVVKINEKEILKSSKIWAIQQSGFYTNIVCVTHAAMFLASQCCHNYVGDI